jgi:branched-chain amino acid transport system substrate-binding protein
VIVSDVGADADRGRLERRVAEAWAARQRGRGGIFGRPLQIDVVGDGGTPAGAVRRAEEALAAGAHALVCCTSEAASVRVAELTTRQRVPLLAPAGRLSSDGPTWSFALEPDDATALQATVRDAYARGLLKLGLATLDGPFGDAVRARLDAFLAAPGLEVVGDVRYPPDAVVLTPEALALAVRLPDAVLLWGLRADGLLALEQVETYGIDVAVDAATRSALRDALLGLAPRQLAAGRYDLQDDDPGAATPEGLRAAQVNGARLGPMR